MDNRDPTLPVHDDHHVDRRWRRTAREQGGAISRRQLHAHGVSPRTASRLVQRGELIRRANGVFVVAGAPTTPETALWVAVLATGGTLAAGTACWTWECLDHLHPEIQVVVGPGHRIVAPPGVVVRRQALPPSAVTTVRGLPVTTRAWSLLDEIGRRDVDHGVDLCDRALQRRWLTLADIDRRLDEWNGRSGNARLREVRRIVGDGARAASERLLHTLLTDAGLTGWRPNVRIRLPGGLVEADVLFERARLVIEVDGLAWHTRRGRFERDRERQNAIVLGQYRVLRFTWSRLTRDPAGVIAEILEALAIAADPGQLLA